MHQYARLRIQLAGGDEAPLAGEMFCNEYRGGPQELLNWLETQLGLLILQSPRSTRISQYSQCLESAPKACFSQSLERDRWSTTSNLLARRDELLLAGWDGKPSEHLPRLVSDLWQAEQQSNFDSPGEAERLHAVLRALDEGQTLPPHCCELHDPLDRWPWMWRQVLTKLSHKPAAPEAPAAARTVALGKIQQQILGGAEEPTAEDQSFRWMQGLSVQASCEAVAAALSAEPAYLSETVICCEQESVALCLDACLARRGLPTMGASGQSAVHPVLQVLPIILNLCWEPVNPALLLDFLSLPVSPIPRQAARSLTQALERQPGLGSRAWEEALKELLNSENDPNGSLQEKLTPWLQTARRPHGEPLPLPMVNECCKRVATWAAGHAGALRRSEEDLELAMALEAASGQAVVLRELAAGQGETLSAPQLRRLVEASQPTISRQPHHPAEGGPRLVNNLAGITRTCRRLIWIGLGTEDVPRSHWSSFEQGLLQKAGIQVDDGSHALAALRSAQRRGLCRVEQGVLAIALPMDSEQRPHPIWVQIQQVLLEDNESATPVIEQILTGEVKADTAPWKFRSSKTALIAPQPPRPLWKLDKTLLREREKSSASSLETRLACPLKWVLYYQARISASAIATLPASFQLKGSFCHAVLEEVFCSGEIHSGENAAGDLALPTKEQALQAVEQIFEARLPLDAAPLAQPEMVMERHQLKQELLSAVSVLVGALQAGGYKIKNMELPFQCTMKQDGEKRELRGYIDCLAADSKGNELVIDFKYGGISKYRELLAHGRATQLATYAFARHKEAKSGSFPQVAYLILSKGVMFSIEAPENKLASQKIQGPEIKQVWSNFSRAISKADSWLSKSKPIPARPLQEPEDWPEGVELNLEGRNKKGKIPEEQVVCRYCEYGVLCGGKELV